MTIISGRHFHLSYPFDLVKFYMENLFSFKSLPKKFHLFFWLYLITATIPIVIYQIFFDEDSRKNRSQKNKYGYAKFASEKLIKKMGLNFEKGIVFGLVRKKFPFGKVKIIKSDQPLSTLIIAPTGTGKTAGFIIPTLKTITNSVVAFDIKGELYQTTHQDRINLGHKILVLDVQDGDIKFNPFARNQLPQDLKKLKSYIKNVSNLLFDSSMRGEGGARKEGNYFMNSAKELFNTVALYLIIQNGYTTISKIKEILLGKSQSKVVFATMGEKIEEQIDEIKKIKDADAKYDKIKEQLLIQVQQGINQILQIADAKDQFSGVVGSLTTVLSAYDDFEIQEIIDCENSSIVADDLRKQKITIYLRVKDADLERLRPLIALFFDTLVSAIISKTPEAEDNQITFVLDEFGNLGKIGKLIKATTISRSYKLNQIFILQDLAQIVSIYSAEERSILESNTAYKIVLQQNSFDTAKRISEIIGYKTDTKLSKSSKDSSISIISQGNNTGSISTSQEGLYLVTPQDILNLNKNQCLLIVQGFSANVVLADIAWWFR
jgi:type IV secretion system protein VirD4